MRYRPDPDVPSNRLPGGKHKTACIFNRQKISSYKLLRRSSIPVMRILHQVINLPRGPSLWYTYRMYMTASITGRAFFLVASLRSKQKPYICIATLNNIFRGSLISSKYKLSLRAYDLLQLTIKMRNMIYRKLVMREYGRAYRQLPKARSLILYTKDPGGYTCTLLDGNVPQPTIGWKC